MCRRRPDAITLRAIAREMGMTANAIYGYFPTRDDLVTTLVNDVYTALADAVDTAWATTPSADPAVRIEAWANAFRTWALVNPQGFRLIYGDPVPGYQAPEEAPPRMPHAGSAPGSPPSRQPPGPTPDTSTRTASSTGAALLEGPGELGGYLPSLRRSCTPRLSFDGGSDSTGQRSAGSHHTRLAAAWATGSMISHPSVISPSSIRQISTTAISGPASGSRRRECITT